MPSFEIPDIPSKAALKQETENGQSISTGAVTFTVTNKTGQGLSGRVTIEPQGEAKAEWFSVDGESERQFTAGGTHTFTVRIKAPPAAKAGTYSLKVRAVAINDPDNDFAESPVVVFDIAAPPVAAPRKGLPWWIFAAIGGGVAVVVGVVAIFMFLPGGTKVPDVVGRPIAEAQQQIIAAGFTVVPVEDADSNEAPGTVSGQDPAADAEPREDKQVTLRVALGIAVPAVVDLPVTEADQQLTAAGFAVARGEDVDSDQAPGVVAIQVPAAGARLGRGGQVTLRAALGVAVPTVVDLPIAEAEQRLTDAGFAVVRSEDADSDKTPGVVFEQNPASDARLPRGGKVALRFAAGVAVPTVVDQSFAVAEGVLRLSHGFKVERKPGTATGKPPETVLGQDPTPSTRLARGGTVTLTVDPGVAVPTNITASTTQRNAVNALQAVGLLAQIGTKCETTGTADAVIDVSPKQGTQVAKGATIAVTVRMVPASGRCLAVPLERIERLDRLVVNPSLFGR